MLKHTILVAAVAGLVLALAPAVASAAVIPPWGEITGSYRLAFVTSTTTQATSADMSYYNGFVNDLAESATSIVKGLAVGEWKCIGSVKGGMDAKTNTNTIFGTSPANVPIYRLDGQLLAATNEILWNGLTELKINRDQTGSSKTIGVFTGTTRYGSHAIGQSMGDSPSVMRGGTAGTAAAPWRWIENAASTNTLTKSLFALSAPIPEPATMTLLAIGGFGVLLKRRRRRA